MMKVSYCTAGVSSISFYFLQSIVLLVAFVAGCTRAEPHVSPLIAAAPVVTAQSSQVFARNYNGIVPFPFAPAPFVPGPAVIPAAAPFSPFAPVPSRFVSPFAPQNIVSPYAPYAYPYAPFAPFPRPLLY